MARRSLSAAGQDSLAQSGQEFGARFRLVGHGDVLGAVHESPLRWRLAQGRRATALLCRARFML